MAIDQVVRIFPSIWESDTEKRHVTIRCFKEGEAEDLAKYFAEHGIETELVTNSEVIKKY